MIVPSYTLPNENIFEFRQREWKESKILDTVRDMLACAEKYDISTKKISFSSSRTKGDQSEIKKTISRLLKISIALAGGTKLIELKYDIPWLQNNYFYIAGNRKIPIFQMFDKPLIVRGDMVKIRTNIQTVQMTYTPSKKNTYNYTLNIFNKKIPLVFFLLSIYGEEELLKMYSLSDGEIVSPRKMSLIEDVDRVISDEILDTTKIFSRFFRGKSDSEIIENIMLLTEVDIFSKRYMYTENIITELLWSIDAMDKATAGDEEYIGKLDDCSLENKRIRCIEYFLYHFLAKDFYNMIVSLKRTKRDSFSNNSKVILINANTSPVVQYEAPINPLDELARLSRLALTGPGGFKKDNIPPYLRDIHPSMFGRVCPADTGDRENCGALQYMVPPMPLKEDGLFRDKHKSAIASVSILHVPFMEHDDPTRLQMASSQMRHGIMLKEFDLPLVQSGLEGMYTQYTSFIFKADRDGKVIYKNKDIIVVQYNNNKCKAFNIGYKKSRLSIVDFYKTYYNSEEENQTLIQSRLRELLGEKVLHDPELKEFIDKNYEFIYQDVQPVRFRKGEIISESNFLNNGRLTIGRNLKTAVMTWYGYNYEDAIVVSDKVKDKLTSVHYLDLSFEISPDKVLLSISNDGDTYKPLPFIKERLKKGDTYAILKTLTNKQEGYNDVVFDTPTLKTVEEDCLITDVKLFVRKRNKLLPVFDEWVTEMVHTQNQKKDDLIDKLRSHLTNDELEQFLLDLEIDETSKEEEKFKVKGESIDGVFVQITAIYERSLQVGDKIGNRHGNKGVISIVVPEEKMPTMPDGSKAEVVLNPLGIISRMNVGQLFELHMGQCVMDMRANIYKKYETALAKVEVLTADIEDVNEKNNIKKKIFSEAEEDICTYVLGFVDIIDCTKNKMYVQQMRHKLENMDLEGFIDNIDESYVIQPPFESVKSEDLDAAMDYAGSQYEYKCFDPIRNDHTTAPVAFGFMYFEKLNHISQDKAAVRGIGPYSSKTNQPLHGKVRKGGQRLGEMEIWSLIAHEATCNLNEVLTVKSDSIKKRNKYISDMIQNTELLLETEEDHVSQSLRLFQCYLKTLGLTYHITEEENI